MKANKQSILKRPDLLKSYFPIIILGMVFLLSSCQKSVHNPKKLLLQQPSLVSFWDFQSKSEKLTYRANGLEEAELIQGEKFPSLVKGEGVFGEEVLQFEEGQWLYIPREKLGELNIHGKEAQVSIIAWVKRESEKDWQAIAGVWDESRNKRQYAIFMNASKQTLKETLDRIPSHNKIHGYVSATGGKTPGKEAWVNYASSNSEVSNGEWHMIAMTYDGEQISVFLDGKLDDHASTNPMPYTDGILDGGTDGADFTVGSVSAHGKINNHFVGELGGLAIFNEALSPETIQEIYSQTMKPKNL